MRRRASRQRAHATRDGRRSDFGPAAASRPADSAVPRGCVYRGVSARELHDRYGTMRSQTRNAATRASLHSAVQIPIELLVHVQNHLLVLGGEPDLLAAA